MAAIYRGEDELSDEGSYASPLKLTIDIAENFLGAMAAAVMAIKALLAVLETLLRIQIHNRKDIADHH